MPPVQTIYTESSAQCAKCDSPLGGHGSELQAENGRKRYLCQSCTELKQALERLFHTEGGTDLVRKQIEILEGMAQHSIYESSERSTYFSNIYNEIYQLLMSLQFLLREADSEQPWD